MPNQTTNEDIIEAIGIFSNATKSNFDAINSKFDEFKMETKENFSKIFKRLDKVEGKTDKIEGTMVTKDYFDETIVNLKTGSSLLVRKEDNKLTSLVSLLKNKALISAEEAENINALEPFAKAC